MLSDPISIYAYKASIAKSLERCFAPWSKMLPEEWATEVYRLPNGARFTWEYAPYSRGMFNSIFDRTVIETCFEMYSRGLKSTVILLAIGYLIDQAPRRILSLWPTNSQAEKWSKDILCGELFNTTPCLNYLGNETGKRVASNTLLHKNFPGGLIDMFGANAPGDMRRAKGSFLYADEIDAIGMEITDEGDQLAIFSKRGDEYPDTIRVAASYPSLKGKPNDKGELVGGSRIDKKFEKSDGNRWNSTCVKCGGEPFVMHRNQIVYKEGNTQTARFVCPRCKELLNDQQRYDMAHKQGYDNWKADRPFRGHRGFHGNAMLWPHPVDLLKFPGGWLQCLADAQVAADESENPRRAQRVIVNTVDAEPYEELEEIVAPKHQPIIDNREDYATSEKVIVPMDARVITVFVDLHGNRLEVDWGAFAKNEETWELGHFVLFGDTNRQEVWDDLSAHLATAWEHESGMEMHLAMCFIDAGWHPDAPINYLRRLREVNVPHVTGKIRLSAGVGAAGVGIVANPWGTIGKKAKGVHIGTWQAKELIYERLAWHSAVEKPKAGFIHFGKCYSEEFIRQSVSENPIKKMINAVEVLTFKNPQGNRNEALDMLVAKLAAFRYIVGGTDFKRIDRQIAECLVAKEEGKSIEPVKIERKMVQIGHAGGWK